MANAYGKTATFMPKPYHGDNGSGMHVHQSVCGKTARTCSLATATQACLTTLWYYIGGIKHARALNAITNPGFNNCKRLVPHFEAPVKLAYSAKNRSASIRIPYVANPKGPPRGSPFPRSTDELSGLCCLLMAGLDGGKTRSIPAKLQRRTCTHPAPRGRQAGAHRATASTKRWSTWTRIARSLTKGGVFTDSMIDAYIELKMAEVTRFRMAVHPVGTTCTTRCDCLSWVINQRRLRPPFSLRPLFRATTRCLQSVASSHKSLRDVGGAAIGDGQRLGDTQGNPA